MPNAHQTTRRPSHARVPLFLGLLAAGLIAIGGWHAMAGPDDAPDEQSGATSPNPDPGAPRGNIAAPRADAASLNEYVQQLRAEVYTTREAATRAIISLGPQVAAALNERLATEHDPEVIYRLRFILENITPPERAVLVLRAPPDVPLAPGEIITHANGQRVRQLGDVPPLAERRMALYRVSGQTGPRDVGPIRLAGDEVKLVNYRAPRGEQLARVMQLYTSGYVEQAYDILKSVGDLPDDEFDRLLFAIIAHTAGDGARAESLLAENGGDAVKDSWSSPSSMDLRGPFKAPYRLEWVDLSRTSDRRTRNDPDLRVQRILAIAHRYADALNTDAGYWWNEYRLALKDRQQSGTGGNMLAVVAWMFHEMELESECARLIQPRSMFLSNDRWLRVQTDAWLPLLAGDPTTAISTIYNEANSILRQPEFDPNKPYRNAHVAAMSALFLYLRPGDARIAAMLETVDARESPALATYLNWMLFSVYAANDDLVRADLLKLIAPPALEGHFDLLASAAVLEYVQEKPADDVFEGLLRRLEKGGSAAAHGAATTMALRALSADKLDEAAVAVATMKDACGAHVLRDTIDFRRSHAGAATSDTLRRALLATPLSAGEWLVVSRERTLLRYNEKSGATTPFQPPAQSTTGWFPGPVNWPWLGRDEKSGRVWVYDRRRVLEVNREKALRLNIKSDDIQAFDELVGPIFPQFADTVLAQAALAPPRDPRAEEGEFLRSEITAYHEFVGDPDLPEISEFTTLAHDPRMVHVAVRGGAQFLLRREDGTTRGVWSTLWVRDQLKLDRPPRFHPQALRSAASDAPAADAASQPAATATAAPPTVFLMSNLGLFRLDTGTNSIARVKLPGDFPYPEVIPESTPYDRRDTRFVYCARLPREGGKVYRVTVADNTAVELEMVNESLPAAYYRLLPRSHIRDVINDMFAAGKMYDIETFITDAAAVARAWKENPD